MRALGIVALLLVAACGKKDDGAKKNEPAPAPAPTDTKPAEPPKGVDCEPLIVAAEVAAACGVDVKDVEIKKGAMEKGVGAMACIRAVRLKGQPWLQMAVNAASPTAEGAKSLLSLSRKSKPDAKKVDVGDDGLLIIDPQPALKSTAHEIEAVKGPLWLKLTTSVQDGGTLPCSDDGMVAVAKAIASHLP